MKIQSRIAICAIALLLTPFARAGDADVTVTSEPKKFDQKSNASQNSDIKSKTEDWGYIVTVQNNTFKPIANLEVKYIVFYKHSQLGVKAPPKKQKASGSFTIQSIPSQDKQTFDTDPIKLTKAALVGEMGGYAYFANGAKDKVDDKLTGIWIRIYQNGALFAEYSDPSDIATSEQWQ